jgi:hypothetical protein
MKGKNKMKDKFEFGEGKYYRQVILSENDGLPPYKVEYSEEEEDLETSVDYFTYKRTAIELFKEIKRKIKNGIPCKIG